MNSKKKSHEKIKLFQDKLLFWFKINGRHHLPWRKEGLSSYEIIIAEILLQRTKAETIDKFYEKFLQLFNNWTMIGNANIEIIENALKPIGLYRQRAKRLKDLALEMIRRNGILPNERNELEQLPFFGQYLVNAILLQIFSIPTPLLDVNMARVLERYFGKRKKADIRYDSYLQSLAYHTVNHTYSKDINWAILDFAAIVCKARKPHCEICILNDTCKFYTEVLIIENVTVKG
jgi:A/G-specific adenine glycosylase